VPRYENVEGRIGKFWEIQLQGRSFTIRFGHIPSDGSPEDPQTKTKTWRNEEEALRAYEEIVRNKIDQGYQLVGATADTNDEEEAVSLGAFGASSPELEARLVADPDAVDVYLVYSDWLQARSDPRGELIAVQVARENTPTNQELLQREARILSEHTKTWLGTELMGVYEADELSVTWRRGFVDSVQLGADDGVEWAGSETYERLVKCGVMKLVRQLDIHLITENEEAGQYARLIGEMAKLGLPQTLRKLSFDARSWQLSWANLGDLSKLYGQLRRLEELKLVVGAMDLGAKMDLPSLRHLTIETGGLSKANLGAVLAGEWQNLQTLTLYFGDPNYGGDCAIEDLEPLLDERRLPSLTHLGLCNAAFADDIARAVVRSNLLPKLRVLDMSKGTLGDAGVSAILEKASALHRLERLIVEDNYLSDEMTEGLDEAFGSRVVIGNQSEEDEEGNRYVQLGE
jgi:uncharacterized protein (TIGR02996 family)